MSANYVVVTGASKGIGKATALYLDQAGFNVFAGVRKSEDADSLRAAASNRLMPVMVDVTNQDQINEAADKISQTVGGSGLVGLVNNAGVAVPSPLEFIPLDELRNQLEINVIGQVAVTQAVLPLIRQVAGRIVNISSIGGRLASPFLGAYHASKFAIEAITDSLRLELRPWGIEVISIEPGVIDTPIWETSLARAERIIEAYPDEAQALYGEQIAKQIADGQKQEQRGISPDQVAKVIAEALTVARPKTRYLVGPDAKFAGNVIVRLPDRLKDRLILSQS